MGIFGTEMHWSVFAVTAIEISFAFHQVVYFLERPSDNKRLLFFILLMLLIFYNISSGLFPDSNLPINLTLQVVLAHLSGVVMSMYFAYYFYKVYNLKRLKMFATSGPIFFILLPFVLVFLVSYVITGNILFSQRLFLVIPIGYGSVFLYFMTKEFKYRYKNNQIGKGEMFSVYMALLCWITMPMIVFVGDYQVLEMGVTNAGFVIMTYVYYKNNILKSRSEYVRLINTENELKAANQTLIKNVDLKTVDNKRLLDQKTNTLINLAHELKTPITLAVNFLKNYEDKNGLDHDLRIMQFNLNKLSRDIVNFFDIEKFKNGKSLYDNTRVTCFSTTLENTIELFRPTAFQKSIRINTKIESAVYLKIDPSALQRIINNLIDNAIRYSAEGKHILIELKTKDHLINFSVIDNGVGIANEHLTTIFKPNYQIDERKANFQGMGMGLSIVNEITASIKAKIDVKSQLGIGSSFSIEFLRHSLGANDKVENIAANPIQEPIPLDIKDLIKDNNRPNIMVVEDNPHMLFMLSDLLSKKYNVYVANNGAEAVMKIENQIHLDLIISDIMMDVIDGFDLYEGLKNNSRYKNVPFLFLSAKTDEQTKSRGYAMGAVNFIEKPFLNEQLLSKVENLLNTIRDQKYLLVDQMSRVNPEYSDQSVLEIAKVKTLRISALCKKYNLSKREEEIFSCLVESDNSGKVKSISKRLYIAESTVKKHITNIYSKLGIHSRDELKKMMVF